MLFIVRRMISDKSAPVRSCMRSLRSFLLSPGGLLGVAAAASGVTAAVLTAEGHHAAAAYALAAFQTAAVAWLAALSWTPERTWARVGVMVAAAWTLTFLISSRAYAADPSLLNLGPPNYAIATVDLSLVCFIAGYVVVLRRRAEAARADDRGPTTSAPYAHVRGAGVSARWASVWIVIGCLGFAAIFAVTGGPVAFISHVSQEGSLTVGRTYFVAAALALVFVAQVLVCIRWANGRALSRWLVAALIAALALTATLGARELIAAPLVEIVLFYALVRRRISVAVGLPVLLAGIFVVVVVFGMVKRYGNYVTEHPGTHIGRVEFLLTKGLGDFASSWANNSADGVRLIALGEQVVPQHAPPEYGKEFLRILLHPVPSVGVQGVSGW